VRLVDSLFEYALFVATTRFLSNRRDLLNRTDVVAIRRVLASCEEPPQVAIRAKISNTCQKPLPACVSPPCNQLRYSEP